MQTNERMSKYTAPPNPQGDRPRSMRSLAINYWILPGSYTVWFSCLLSRSGDPWQRPNNWGLGTKNTQAHTHIPLALWYNGSLWMNPPYAFNGSRGGGGMAYMAMVNISDSTQGMVKIWETTRHGNQLARPSWDVVNPGFG